MHINNNHGIYRHKPSPRKFDPALRAQLQQRKALKRKVKFELPPSDVDLSITTALFLSVMVLGSTCVHSVAAVEQGAMQQNIERSLQTRALENTHFNELVHHCNETEHRLHNTQNQYNRCVGETKNLTAQLEAFRQKDEDVGVLRESLEEKKLEILKLRERLAKVEWHYEKSQKMLKQLKSIALF